MSIVAPMHVEAVKTRLFRQGEDLAAFIQEHLAQLADGSIVAVASKIVALSEGRVAMPTDEEKLIRQESEWQRRVWGKWWLTTRDGTLAVNAGIDASNADGKLVLPPKDSFAAAREVRLRLMQTFNAATLGVIITDSRVQPLRAGVVGVALGYAGFKGVRDYRGTPDLFGRPLEVSRTDVADSLATAAVLVMGEGSERQPLAVIKDAPVEWVSEVDRGELTMPREQDLFKHLFE